MSGFKISSGEDLDNIFQPYVYGNTGAPTGYMVNGVDIANRYQNSSGYTGATAINYNTGSIDLNQRFVSGTNIYTSSTGVSSISGEYTIIKWDTLTVDLVFSIPNVPIYALMVGQSNAGGPASEIRNPFSDALGVTAGSGGGGGGIASIRYDSFNTNPSKYIIKNNSLLTSQMLYNETDDVPILTTSLPPQITWPIDPYININPGTASFSIAGSTGHIYTSGYGGHNESWYEGTPGGGGGTGSNGTIGTFNSPNNVIGSTGWGGGGEEL